MGDFTPHPALFKVETANSGTRFRVSGSSFFISLPPLAIMTAPSLSSTAMDMFPASVPDLLDALRALRRDNPKATRSNVHIYPAKLYAPDETTQSDRRLTSWKMTEHLYFRKDNGFPTLARGLFTEELQGSSPPEPAMETIGTGGQERIVARGYDKFFNIDEMSWTTVSLCASTTTDDQWDAIEKHTSAPYHLTLKSNGCLIMISALSPTHLVVASKHSLGTTTEGAVTEVTQSLKDTKLDDTQGREDANDETSARAHAEVGREWVARTLKKSGKTSQDLARRLWDENLTAVLELCDDSFEEHVIATPEYWTGLHLHGLNYNQPHFSTKSPEDVAVFAGEFGFIPTKHVTLNSVAEVRKFAHQVAETGSWQGDMIEGFVVRSTVKGIQGHESSKPPYRPGAPFFFKIKFEEPYLLYRQFRETTRVMLPLLDQKITPVKAAEIWKKVKAKTRRPEVGVYAEWCAVKMKEEPSLFAHFERGVVRVRERFLKWIEGEGKKTWDLAQAGEWKANVDKAAEVTKAARDAEREALPKKWVIVPVAVPGCGKTTMGLALSRLFAFAHTQSDDILSKKTAPTFKRNIVELLKTNDVVYADRNNHIDKHYVELSGLADEKTFAKTLKPYHVKYIFVTWNIDANPYHKLLRLCSERVVSRGDNHQTLRPDLTVEAEHEAVVASFLHNFTTPAPMYYDEQIVVDVEDSPRIALGKVVDKLVGILGLRRPSESEIDAALAAVSDYKVTTPYHAPARLGKAVRYFGLAPEIDLAAVVEDALKTPMSAAAFASVTKFMDALKEKGRVTQRPHITLSHNKNVAVEKEAAGDGAAPGPQQVAWDTCTQLAESPISPFYEFDITHLAWDDRTMALIVGNLRPQESADREKGSALVLPEEVKVNLHITVGTQGEDISAFESRGVVRVARESINMGKQTGEAGESTEGGGVVHWVEVGPLTGSGRVRGMF